MGQFTAPQNTDTRPMAAAKAGGRPSSPPRTQPKVAPTKNDGTTSPPLKPQPMVTAVEAQLQQPGPGVRLAGQGARHHIHARAVIVRSTQQQRGGHDHAAARGGTEEGILQDTGGQVLGDVQAAAEEDTHQSAAHSQHRHKAQSEPGQRRHGHGEAGGLHAHEESDVVAGQRGGDTGQQPGVVQHAHADDLQSEDGGRQGCAEEGGEHARHAAEGGQGQVLLPRRSSVPVR